MYQYFPNCERDSTYHTVILPSTMSKKTLPNVISGAMMSHYMMVSRGVTLHKLCFTKLLSIQLSVFFL